MQRAVEDEAVPRGVVVFSASLDEDPARERALARQFGARHADGLLLAPAGDDQSYLAAELRAGTAIVCLDREAHNLPVDSVLSTNAIGAAEAVRHLAAAGHRRIAFLGDRRTIPTAGQRFAGYRDATDVLGLPADPSLEVHDLRTSADADGAVTALLGRPDPPTALFTAQNLVTIGAVRALRRLGLEQVVALAGFDDFLLADLLSQAGFACRTSEFAPQRTSLVARIGYLRADFAWSCCPETVVNEPRRLFISALAELD